MKYVNINETTRTPSKSLIVKYGWKGILSKFIDTPNGFLEPFSWIKTTWIIANNIKMKGIKKCNVKNRIKVLLSTENPPQIQQVTELPIYGIAEIKFVITVAPQNDIWPQGKIYPKKAVAINTKIIKIPDVHTFLKKKEE